MDKYKKIKNIRNNLLNGNLCIGSWLQIENETVAEIISSSGYSWIAIDMEHGSFSMNKLPNMFRSIEINNVLPLVRIPPKNLEIAKRSLDAGAGGIILPNIETSEQIRECINELSWPPKGKRGVGYSRANNFGKSFEQYKTEAQNPLIIAMIESIKGAENLDEILKVEGLDAIFIGPYDLSASIGKVGKFNNEKFKNLKNLIIKKCKDRKIACGVHVVEPDKKGLKMAIKEGYTFIAYSIDTVFLNTSSLKPEL